MKEFKVYLTQNYQPITVSAKTQEEAENEVKVRFRKSGHGEKGEVNICDFSFYSFHHLHFFTLFISSVRWSGRFCEARVSSSPEENKETYSGVKVKVTRVKVTRVKVKLDFHPFHPLRVFIDTDISFHFVCAVKVTGVKVKCRGG